MMSEKAPEEKNYFYYLNLARREYHIMLEKYPEIASLSPRELEVFSYLFSDKTLAEIAQELYITYSSVHFHCKNIYRKLDVTGRRQILIKYKDI
ncbi:MAG: helix-turn-helix transcriptional regulator [Ruminococcus sp.]|nr:helix-turn-helix transcriptional regulator [Ruminococcus sp.]